MSPSRTLLGLLSSVAILNAADLSWQRDDKAGELRLISNGRPALTWSFASNQFKPYIKSLRAITGEEVLRDAPADHLHHHGLMYAIRVNGINFWEERDQPGHEKHIAWIGSSASAASSGPARASATELIHWIAHSNAAIADTRSVALLIERRTIDIELDEARGQVVLRWRGEFAVGRDRVTLHGSDYNGLGLRLPEDWDRTARHRNSGNLPYSAEQKWDLLPGRWAAVSHGVRGREITVALAGSAANRGDTRFFSMTNPFTYLAVTQNLSKAPLEYGPGETFTIEYTVIVFSRALTSAEISSALSAGRSNTH